MWIHNVIERRVDPFLRDTLYFEVLASLTIPIKSCLKNNIYEKLLLLLILLLLHILKSYFYILKLS